MALILFIIGLAIIIATIIFLFVVHFNRFEKFTDIFQYWLDPRYRLLYDAYVYYKKSQKLSPDEKSFIQVLKAVLNEK